MINKKTVIPNHILERIHSSIVKTYPDIDEKIIQDIINYQFRYLAQSIENGDRDIIKIKNIGTFTMRNKYYNISTKSNKRDEYQES